MKHKTLAVILFVIASISTTQAAHTRPPVCCTMHKIIAAICFISVLAFHGTAKAHEAMNIKINDIPVVVKWEDNESVKALRERIPITVKMSMYGGFEQVGGLGRKLPRNDKRITTSAGDIVLYSGNQIVIFYGSNTWAYTKLGRITDKTASELADMLGNSDVTITLSTE